MARGRAFPRSAKPLLPSQVLLPPTSRETQTHIKKVGLKFITVLEILPLFCAKIFRDFSIHFYWSESFSFMLTPEEWWANTYLRSGVTVALQDMRTPTARWVWDNTNFDRHYVLLKKRKVEQFENVEFSKYFLENKDVIWIGRSVIWFRRRLWIWNQF